MIELSLNNEIVNLAPNTALHSALAQWGYQQKQCAVAINGEFIPRSQYTEVTLCANDEIDVVAAVGGG